MAISKLIFNGSIQMDVTSTTAVASGVSSGMKFTLADGTEGTGTASFQPAVMIESLNVTSNGTYSASSGYAFDPVVVSVPTGITPTGTSNIYANGTYDVTNYASAFVSVAGGGGISADDIAEKTISGAVIGETASHIAQGAFANCYYITGASFPNCISIYNNAFSWCSRLTYADFPNCTSIEAGVFSSCIALSSINFPKCESIGQSAFYGCRALVDISFSSCKYIGASAFGQCTGLTNASFSVCGSVWNNAFANDTLLESIYFPVCSSVSNSAFYNCQKLKEAVFPSCKTIGSQAFDNCLALSAVDFPVCSSINSSGFRNCPSLINVSFPNCHKMWTYAFGNCYSLTAVIVSHSYSTVGGISGYAFNNCYNLVSLYLLASTIYTLTATAFANTPISGYTTSTGGIYGSIYVLESMYSAYIASNNWSLYSNRIVSLTDAQVANVLASGTHL